MKAWEIGKILLSLKDNPDLTPGELIDLVMDPEEFQATHKTKKSKAKTEEPEAPKITQADLNAEDGFDPNKFLVRSETLYKQLEIKIAEVKSQDVADSFSNIKFTKSPFVDEFKHAYDEMDWRTVGPYTLLDLYEYLYESYMFDHGLEPPESWQCERLAWLNEQTKLCFKA